MFFVNMSVAAAKAACEILFIACFFHFICALLSAPTVVDLSAAPKVFFRGDLDVFFDVAFQASASAHE